MAQKLIDIQEQKLALQQRLTQQQLMFVRMLEMPLTEFEQSVQAEIDDNPALEVTSDDLDIFDHTDDDDTFDSEGNDIQKDSLYEQEERLSALDDALQSIGRDDEMPEAEQVKAYNYDNADYEEIVYGDRKSFYDSLNEQMSETELKEEQATMMEYLIGSLDNDGLLRKSLDTIVDELAVYNNIYVSEQDLEQVLTILQSFDPAGIGARSLQECLLLQIERKPKTAIRELMKKVIGKHFDSFMSNNWDKITSQMQLDEDTANGLREEILRLNPKPGAALGETEGINLQQITPDFIVDTADDGTITFTINRGHVPDLYVSPSFTDMLNDYKNAGESMSRSTKEALLYARQKVERARSYIDAIKQRHNTLYKTMKVIVDIQKDFFRSGDESDLHPMVLKDVAQRTGLDISTISRVSMMKYAQTRWGMFRLRHFFSEGIKTSDGEEMSTRKIKAALKEMIESEDKKRPMNDDVLSAEMEKKGYKIARRTVAKYREQLGIPTARLRKE